MLADGMSHSAEMDQSAIETVSTINITVSSEISTVDITSEMKAFFDSSWEADTFVSKIDWFVKLTFCKVNITKMVFVAFFWLNLNCLQKEQVCLILKKESFLETLN